MTNADDRRHWHRLLGELVSVNDLLLTDVETQVLVDRLVSVAARTLPEVDVASVTVHDGDVAKTLAATEPAALRVDQAQYDSGDGPCVRALNTGEEIQVVDLAAVEWSAVAEAAEREGLRASLSIPMRNGEALGVLNLYSRRRGAFTADTTLEDARVFARYAATVFVAHTRYHKSEETVQQLHGAMQSRAVIEQAKGMIMLRERCTADEAFQILVKTSQHSHHKLRDIASRIVASVASDQPTASSAR